MTPGLSQSQILSFNKYLPEIYSALGTVSGIGNKTVNKTNEYRPSVDPMT